jgi:hypothetical protein
VRLLLNWAVIKEPTILVTAVIYGLLAAYFIAGGLWGGFWVAIFVIVSFWRYCYVVLRVVAQGRKHVPAPDIETMSPIGETRVLAHFVLFPLAIILLSTLQPLGFIAALLFAVMFPASAALLAINGSVIDSLSSGSVTEFARLLGRDYWALVAGTAAVFVFLSALSGALFAGFSVTQLVMPNIPLMPMFVGTIAVFWVVLILFALAGSALRTHRVHFEIPGELRPPEEEMLKQRHREWQKDLDIAYTSFRSGVTSAGYKTLHSLVERNGDSFEVNYWLVENMLDWEEKRFAFEVVEKLMPRLLAAGHAADALKLYQRCRWRDPEFTLPAEQSRELAAHAAAFGQTGLAGELGYTSKDLQAR